MRPRTPARSWRAYEDPALGGSDGDGGPWQTTADGGLLLDRDVVTLRYEMFGDGNVIGRFETLPSSMDAPVNVWDTAYIFTRVE